MNIDDLQLHRSPKPGLIYLAVAGGALLAGILIAVATLGVIRIVRDPAALAPTAQSHLCLMPEEASTDTAALSDRATRARRAEARHAEAVHRLSVDRRWEEPEQHEALSRAMRDAVHEMVRYRETAHRLEAALARRTP